MESKAIYIVDALRTPIGNIDGSLAALSAPQLGVPVVKELIKRYPLIREETNHIILGNSVSAGVGQNPARQTAVWGGINIVANAFTVNQVCGSGLSVVGLAKAMMIDQEAQVVLAGAVESCSNTPYLVERRRKSAGPEDPLGESLLRESLLEDGLQCPIEDVLMGEIAEEYAQEHGITREEQDNFALISQERAHRAEQLGLYDNERISLSEASASLNQDEKIRHNLNLQKLTRLKPVFKEEGTVTAGNTAGLGDCGCLLFLASGEYIKKNGLSPKVRVVDTYSLGTPMKSVFTGPAQVLSQLLRKNSLTVEDIDLFEVCEAFACTVVGFLRETKIPQEKINIYGGDIALGHPLGASGTRMMVTLSNALIQEEKRLGVVLMSMGGGHSIGILMERPRGLPNMSL